MKELVQTIASSLVDYPDEVQVETVEKDREIVLQLSVNPGDLGKVIGKQGRTARAMRTLLGAASVKTRKKFMLEILD